MKDLKRGDFVYHKSLGRGIVYAIPVARPENVRAFFENHSNEKTVQRVSLFVKGDLIYVRKGKDKRWWKEQGRTFYEPMLHNPECESSYTYHSSEYVRVQYATDVKHAKQKPEPVPVECPLFTIDASNDYMPVPITQDAEKRSLLKRIEILELQAKIKELEDGL